MYYIIIIIIIWFHFSGLKFLGYLLGESKYHGLRYNIYIYILVRAKYR